LAGERWQQQQQQEKQKNTAKMWLRKKKKGSRFVLNFADLGTILF